MWSPSFARVSGSPGAVSSRKSASAAKRLGPLVESLEDRSLLSGITPVILADTVPSQVLAGSKLRSAISLSLTNSDPSTDDGFAVNIYASPDGTLNTATDPLVTSVIRSTRLGSLKTTALKINIASLPPSLVVGQAYNLIAETVDASGNTAFSASNSTVTVAPATISFTETVASTFPAMLVSGTKVKGSIKVGITNTYGNVTSKGKVTINLTASTTPGVVGTSIASVTKTLTIPVARKVFVTVPLGTLPVLATGQYYIVAEVTDPNGDVTIATSTPVTIQAPTITLVGAIEPIGKVTSGATVLVTNRGNVADVSVLRGTFGVSTDAAGLNPAGSTVTLSSPKLDIPVGRTARFHVKPSKAFLSNLTAGVPYYLTVTFVDATGNIGTAVSPNSFTI